LFVIVLAAAEAAVGLAIIHAIYQMVRNIDASAATTLKE
jgi:NADH:ubiquinone oxidoreductase subunit K